MVTWLVWTGAILTVAALLWFAYELGRGAAVSGYMDKGYELGLRECEDQYRWQKDMLYQELEETHEQYQKEIQSLRAQLIIREATDG